MWNRKELKAKAKAAFKRNYWYCVLVALLVMLIVGAFSGSVDVNQNAQEAGKFAVKMSASAAGLVMLVRLLALNPLSVGAGKFFADNAAENAPLNDLTVGFTGNYIRNVLALLLRDIFIALWSLLLVIPGIVKTYSYRMVPYILADDPTIEAKEAIDMSRQMMRGQKWKAFMLDLSFLGWMILNLMTFGLLGVFYVNPYIDATNAELYLALKNK